LSTCGSNCVLNLVEGSRNGSLFDENLSRPKKGGRAVISDIVSDEEVPEELQNDPELWSGCISGALPKNVSCPRLKTLDFTESRF